MTLSAAQRWTLYVIGLCAAVAAVFWVDSDREDAAAVVPSAHARSAADAASVRDMPPPESARKYAELAIDGLPVRAHRDASGNPFSSRSWAQMAAQEAARDRPPPPPPAPQPPPLPFSYMGKLIEGKITTVFLTSNDRNYVARVGETLDGRYRVEEIGEDEIVLTYLPLKYRQELAFDTEAMSGRAMTPHAGQDAEEYESTADANMQDGAQRSLVSPEEDQ